MKIAIFPVLTAEELQTLKQVPNVEWVDFSQNKPSAEELAQFEIILGWDILIKDALQLNHSIKWIQLWMVGVDNLPFDLLAQSGVVVTTAKGANAITIAQQTVGSLIMFARQLHISRDQQNKGEWFIPTDLTELTEKKLLRLGLAKLERPLLNWHKLSTCKSMV